MRHPTPLGEMLLMASGAGVVLCDFADGGAAPSNVARVRALHGSRARPAEVMEMGHEDVARREAGAGSEGAGEPVETGAAGHLRRLAAELDAYFAGGLRVFETPLDVRGTPFELRVWAVLCGVPYGQTRTYGQQAAEIGSPRAVRAVGRTNGRNPVAVVVPCHRIVGSSGALTGYAGGVERKRWLLDHERR